jgi:hypothetical protein
MSRSDQSPEGQIPHLTAVVTVTFELIEVDHVRFLQWLRTELDSGNTAPFSDGPPHLVRMMEPVQIQLWNPGLEE